MRIGTKKLPLLLFFCALMLSTSAFSAFSQQSDIDAKDETGLTPLMLAAQDGADDEIKKLLKKGANPEIKDHYGWTALMHATAAHLAMFPETNPSAAPLKALLAANADVNVADHRGNTPLMIAAVGNKTEFVKLLLSKGANVNATNKKGATALSYAKAKAKEEIVKLLERAGGTGIELDKANVPEKLTPIDVLPKRLNAAQARAPYTDEARNNGITGTVRIRILVAADGTIRRWKIISGLPYGLNEQVVKAVSKSKVTPAMHEGKAIDYWFVLQYSFSIN